MNLLEILTKSPKKTPVKAYIWTNEPVEFPGCKVLQGSNGAVVFGEWGKLAPVLEQKGITDVVLECDRRNSPLPLMDLPFVDARVEPGALIRQGAVIGKGAIIMMGAVVNIGAQVGGGTMVDMNAVLGGRAIVGENCHIGAGAVLAGVIEPPSAQPVVIEDRVMIGANAVVLEGVRVGADSVVAAGAVVTKDVPAGAVVAGSPARIIKYKDEKTAAKTGIRKELR